MSIRPATVKDIPALSDLIVRSIRVLNANEHTPDALERVCALFSEERLNRDLLRRDMFILEDEGPLIGTISLGGGMLHSLFVEPAQASKGHGRLLVNHIEKYARSKHLEKLSLRASLTAVPFYQKLGYIKLSEVKVDFGSTWEMEKVL